MMNDVMPSIVQMDAEELQKLVAEVKETVATCNSTAKTKRKNLSEHWICGISDGISNQPPI